jgi:CubicO group peptidase (beta-lactamase class C family)
VPAEGAAVLSQLPFPARLPARSGGYSPFQETTTVSSTPRCPHFIFALLILGAAPVALRSAEPQIGAALQPFVDSGTLAGAVLLVASPDKVLSLDAVGFADVAAKKPLRTDDLFWIASMSKPMTAAAVMMLVDEGKVRLDDPVEKYLPAFQGQMVLVESSPERVVLQKPSHPITVREVLSHTSGLPFMSNVEQQAHHIDTLPLREAVLSYALTPLKTEPGSKYDYSNAGINTAGRIVEVVSGMPYEEFMQRRLFDPLGMKDTTFRPSPEQAQRVAKSYRPDSAKTGLEEITIDQLSYPLTRSDRYPCPGGGLFSTAADVAAFCQMVLSGGTFAGKRYLSEPAVREMTSTQTGKLIDQTNGEGGYGLGWSTSRKSTDPSGGPISGPPILGNCGHGGAYATNMNLDPGRRLITVFMVQHAGFPGPDGGKIHGTFVNAANEAFGK